MKKMLTKGMILSCLAFAGLQASAQVYPYFVDFESDSIKAYASSASVNLNGINWTLPGVYLGDMEPSDRKHGLHAARVRLTDNMTGDNGTLTMQDDLTQGIGTISFYHSLYGSETGGGLAVFYSTNQGGTWTQAGAAITPGASLALATIPVNIAGPVRISIRKTDGTNSRVNIDDIMITGNAGYATKVVVTDKTPVGRNVLLETDTLTIQFNENVAKGTGNIVLHNVTDNSDQTIDVTSADVQVNGQRVTVSGIVLESARKYAVSFDSTVFTNTGATLKSTGIYGNLAWTFTAIDTSTPEGLLSETFENCMDPIFGQFSAYSVTGNQEWRCGTQGHTDNYSVYINGGFSGGANDNQDWLITTAKVDITAVNNPVLEFWTKVRYTGSTTKQVLVSLDYTGTGNPSAATWQTVKDITNEVSGTDWVAFSQIPLTSYKANPFYLAFKYVSAAANNGAQEWTVDDISIGSGFPESVPAYQANELDLKVLGQATGSRIVLSVTLPKTADMTISMYDLNGRKVYGQTDRMQAGTNHYTVAPASLTPGMYLIRVGNDRYHAVVKSVVQ